MKRITLTRLAGLMAGLVLLTTGCSLDVESFLQPPRAQGEQQAIQAALDTYLRDTGSVTQRYTLKYPSEGEHTSAFVLCDEQGRPIGGDTKAQLAVVFYALSSAPEETHVNLLRREDAEWVSVGDSVGYGAAIRQVAFGDLDGDGMAELLTGWSTYDSKNHRLGVFSMETELTALSADRVYTQLFAGDLTAADHDSLLLLHIGGGNSVTATLETMADGRLTTVQTVHLDGYIQQFGSMTLCALGGGVHGLYVDAVKSTGTTITELLYYDDKGLYVPFYDPVTNETTVTARATGLVARDVDGDALVEVPVCRPLPGYAYADTAIPTGWLTTWMSFDYTTGRWTDRLYTVVNPTDGYLVNLGPIDGEEVTTAYDGVSRTLDLLDAGSDRVWLRLSAAGEGEPPATGMEQVELLEATHSLPGCTAWYDPQRLEEEKVRYMVIRLQDGKE